VADPRLRMLIAAAVGLVTLVASPTFAAEGGDDTTHRFYVRAGAAGFFYLPALTVRSGGNDIPGADASLSPNFTPVFELGVFPFSGLGLLDDLSVSLTVGFPPEATVDGAGSLASSGTIGKARYGPSVLSAHYHFRHLPIVHPYVGAGFTYVIIFSTEDGALKDLHVDPAFGAVFQTGVDVPIDGHWGLYADAKLALLSLDVTGTLNGAPTTANLPLNPIIVTLGGSYRF